MTDRKNITIGKQTDQFHMHAQTGKGGKKIVSVGMEYSFEGDVNIQISAGIKPGSSQFEFTSLNKIKKDTQEPATDVPKAKNDVMLGVKVASPDENYIESLLGGKSFDSQKRKLKGIKKSIMRCGVSDEQAGFILEQLVALKDVCESQSDKVFGADKLKSIAEVPALKALAKTNAQHFAAGPERG